MIHHTHVTGMSFVTENDRTIATIQLERLPQGTPAPEQPPLAVDLPPDFFDTLRRWLDPKGDQP